jgi:hypothetical protein
MKTDIRTESVVEGINKASDMELENIIDILERINGLSFEGQRQIYAYLKTQIDKSGKWEEWKRLR